MVRHKIDSTIDKMKYCKSWKHLTQRLAGNKGSELLVVVAIISVMVIIKQDAPPGRRSAVFFCLGV